MAPGLGVLALVETVLSAVAVGHSVVRRCLMKLDALLGRCTTEVEQGGEAWIAAGSRDDPDAAARRDAATEKAEALK